MAYRSDLTAVEARKAALEAELAEVRSRREAAERDLPVLKEEEQRLAAAIGEARCAVLTLRPPLAEIRVASPCSADWEAMRGDARVRFCGACRKNVYNLSAMTNEEASRVVDEREGSICVRFFRRADGTVLTSDCHVGARHAKRWRVAVVAGAVVTTFVGAAMLMQSAMQGEVSQGEVAQGVMAVPEPAEEVTPPTVALPPAERQPAHTPKHRR